MGDDDGGDAAGLERLERVQERLLAGQIEAGIGLVEDDEARVAVERAGQADALALAAGQ